MTEQIQRGIRSFDDLPDDLRFALAACAEHTKRLRDPASQSVHLYAVSMGRAIQRFPDRPWSAVYTQLLYILSNGQYWRGDAARKTKTVFRKYVKIIEEYGLDKY